VNVVTLLNRLLGRDGAQTDITSAEVRDMVRERQDRQAARLRALDLQAEPHMKRRRR
jgi:hypothetical protein